MKVNDDFTPLFNGKDLDGWKTHAKQPGDWQVKDGVLIGAGPAASTLYTTRDDYKDFHLRVEARINDGGLGAVWCRAPFGPLYPKFNSTSPIGFETRLNNTNTIPNRTGALSLRDVGSVTTHGNSLVFPPEEWFVLEVIAQGDKVHTKVNGRPSSLVLDRKSQFQSGHIGLYLERPQSVIEFRKIEIKEAKPVVARPVEFMPPKLPVGNQDFVPLFNGKDTDGWQPHAKRPGDWRVEKGILDRRRADRRFALLSARRLQGFSSPRRNAHQ